MIRYRIVVSSPYHGEIFEARCTERTLDLVIRAANLELERYAADIATREIPVNFEVKVA